MDTRDSICPSRVRAMLASRACRSSVMIGDPLGRKEMERVIILLVIIYITFWKGKSKKLLTLGINSKYNISHVKLQ